MGQYATQYVAISNGLGQSSLHLDNSSHLKTLNTASRAGVVLFLCTLYASKASAIALISRFAARLRHKLTIFGLLALLAVLGLASILSVTLSCGLTGPYYWHIARDASLCSNQYMRWQVVAGFDITTEILILILPVDLVWSLQMRLKTKFSVLSRFWVRLP